MFCYVLLCFNDEVYFDVKLSRFMSYPGFNPLVHSVSFSELPLVGSSLSFCLSTSFYPCFSGFFLFQGHSFKVFLPLHLVGGDGGGGWGFDFG